MGGRILKLSREFDRLRGQSRAIDTAIRLMAAMARVLDTDEGTEIESAHISGISFDNLMEPGISWLEAMASDGHKFRVPATINPAAFSPFSPPPWAREDHITMQRRAIDALVSMGADPVMTCAPYFHGYRPSEGSHVAWAESSAVTYANSVLGAYTSKESGPSAVAAALLGFTVHGGLHLEENRQPGVTIEIHSEMPDHLHWGALGIWLGRTFGDTIPYIIAPTSPDTLSLQALASALPTYGGPVMFYVEGITPRVHRVRIPSRKHTVTASDIAGVFTEYERDFNQEPDLLYIGCPHTHPEYLRVLPTSSKVRILTGGPADCTHPMCLAGGCAAVARLPAGIRRIGVDSFKAAFYMRSKGYEVNVLSRDEIMSLLKE